MRGARLLLLTDRPQLVGHPHLELHGLASLHLHVDEVVDRTVEHGLALLRPVPQVHHLLAVHVQLAGTDTHEAERVLARRRRREVGCRNRRPLWADLGHRRGIPQEQIRVVAYLGQHGATLKLVTRKPVDRDSLRSVASGAKRRGHRQPFVGVASDSVRNLVLTTSFLHSTLDAVERDCGIVRVETRTATTASNGTVGIRPDDGQLGRTRVNGENRRLVLKKGEALNTGFMDQLTRLRAVVFALRGLLRHVVTLDARDERESIFCRPVDILNSDTAILNRLEGLFKPPLFGEWELNVAASLESLNSRVYTVPIRDDRARCRQQ